MSRERVIYVKRIMVREKIIIVERDKDREIGFFEARSGFIGGNG